MTFSRSWRIKSSYSFSRTTSSKNSAASQRERRHQRHQSSTHEPVSPRVSCLGRIKRCNSLPPQPTPPPFLRRGLQFLTVPTSSSSSSGSSPATGKSKREMAVEEMDPPLPVEKRKDKPYFVESLWRRRCRDDRADLAELKLCRPERLPTGIQLAANSGVVA